MMDEEIGKRIDAYLTAMGAGDEPDPSLLAELLELLPSGARFHDLEGIAEALQEFGNSVPLTQAEPLNSAELGREFVRGHSPEPFAFSVPIGLTQERLEIEIGGRYQLTLSSDPRSAQGEVVAITGSLDSSHWWEAMRGCLELRDEFLGLLDAAGLVRSWLWSPHGLPTASRNLATLRVVSRGYEGEPWMETLSIPDFEQLARTRVGVPQEMTDLELRRDPSAVLEDRVRLAGRPFVLGGEAAARLQRAARFLRKATITRDGGESYLFMATCLEGLLVEGDDSVAKRVCEAVSFVVGRSLSQRKEAREVCKRLYNVRSRFVHDGQYVGDERHRMACLALTRRALFEEVRGLE